MSANGTSFKAWAASSRKASNKHGLSRRSVALIFDPQCSVGFRSGEYGDLHVRRDDFLDEVGAEFLVEEIIPARMEVVGYHRCRAPVLALLPAGVGPSPSLAAACAAVRRSSALPGEARAADVDHAGSGGAAAGGSGEGSDGVPPGVRWLRMEPIIHAALKVARWRSRRSTLPYGR